VPPAAAVAPALLGRLAKLNLVESLEPPHVEINREGAQSPGITIPENLLKLGKSFH
jgi:hypothetical protein